MFRHAATRQVAVGFDAMAAPAESGNEGADLDAFEIEIIVRCLIRDHDVEVGKGLPEKTG